LHKREKVGVRHGTHTDVQSPTVGQAVQNGICVCWQLSLPPPPGAQRSFVHGSPSSHRESVGVCVQPTTGLQSSIVQAMPSSQLRIGNSQVPLLQMLSVHRLPSLQSLFR